MRVGAHIGVGGGWPQAAEYGHDVGCECVQVFSKNPRSWRAGALDVDGVAEYWRRAADYDLGPLFVHTSYLINLGSHDMALWERSIAALSVEMDRAAAIGAAGLVTHLGTDPSGDPAATANRMADAVRRAWESAEADPVTLLLENSAGAGTIYGSTPEELGVLREALSNDGPVGVCVDTCHLHVSGVPLSSRQDWDAALERISDAFPLGSLGLVHANDAMFPAGSHRDRHAWIGEGTIGQDGFVALFAQPALRDVPLVIEMPGEPPEKDAENLRRLKALRDRARAAGR